MTPASSRRIRKLAPQIGQPVVAEPAAEEALMNFEAVEEAALKLVVPLEPKAGALTMLLCTPFHL